MKQLCHKVNHISGGTTSEAIEIVLVQLQAWMPVIVEWAAGHTVAAHFQSIVCGGLLYGNSRLDAFIDRHLRTSLSFRRLDSSHPNIRKKSGPPVKSGIFARKQKSRPEKLQKCNFQGGTTCGKCVDIVL
jgi:hypothetical protein